MKKYIYINQAQSILKQQDGCVDRETACGAVEVGFAIESGQSKDSRFHVSHCIKKTHFEILTISLLREKIIFFGATESTAGLSCQLFRLRHRALVGFDD